jgi:hypothetical protein
MHNEVCTTWHASFYYHVLAWWARAKYEVHLKIYQHVTISGVLWKFVPALVLYLPARFAVVIAAFPNTKAFWDINAVSNGKWSPTFRQIVLPSSSVYYLTQRKSPEDLKHLTSVSTHCIVFYETCRNSLLIRLYTCGSTAVSVPVFIQWHFIQKCWFRYYRTKNSSSSSRALIHQVRLMIKSKCIFSHLSFALLCFSFSLIIQWYRPRITNVGCKEAHAVCVALDKVYKDACTNRITDCPVWDIFSLAERLLVFPKSVLRSC